MHYEQNGVLKSWKSDAAELKGAQAPQHVGTSWKYAKNVFKKFTFAWKQNQIIFTVKKKNKLQRRAT